MSVMMIRGRVISGSWLSDCKDSSTEGVEVYLPYLKSLATECNLFNMIEYSLAPLS